VFQSFSSVSAELCKTSFFYIGCNHDVFGIVNHATNKSTVNLFDERIEFTRICTLAVFILDNYITLPVLTKFALLWLGHGKWYKQGKIDFICILFMIPDHTKLVPDQLFSKIATKVTCLQQKSCKMLFFNMLLL